MSHRQVGQASSLPVKKPTYGRLKAYPTLVLARDPA
jgi:hypothetical protein